MGIKQWLDVLVSEEFEGAKEVKSPAEPTHISIKGRQIEALHLIFGFIALIFVVCLLVNQYYTPVWIKEIFCERDCWNADMLSDHLENNEILTTEHPFGNNGNASCFCKGADGLAVKLR
jgi:hypothetical protein